MASKITPKSPFTYFQDTLIFELFRLDTAQIELIACEIFKNITLFIGPEGKLSALKTVLEKKSREYHRTDRDIAIINQAKKLVDSQKKSFFPKGFTPLACAKNSSLTATLEKTFSRPGSFIEKGISFQLFEFKLRGPLFEIDNYFKLNLNQDSVANGPYTLSLSLNPELSEQRDELVFVIKQYSGETELKENRFTVSELASADFESPISKL